ncbi:MAG: polyhydroxyalkanoic acid system family protein [Planctomycetia bacterium]
MKSLEVRVAHGLSPEEVRRRLDDALVRARTEFADTVGPIEARWETEDRMAIQLAVMGMQFDGSVEVLLNELLVTLQLPGMAQLFAGRISAGIEERLGGLLGSQQV